MNTTKKSLLSILVIFLAMLFLQMTCLAGQLNLVANSDVETGSPANWSKVVGGGASATQTWATNKYVSSSHSLKTVMSNSVGCADWQQQFTSIDTTVTYRFRVHIYASNVAAGSHSAEIQWFNGSTYLSSSSSMVSTTANSWVEVKLLNITPPTNATKAYVILRTYKAGTYYFDDIVFMREDKNLIKIDGNFPLGLYSLPNTQIINNPDMEYLRDFKGNGMYPPGWTAYPYSGDPIFVWDTANYLSGACSLKLTMASSGLSDWRQKVTDIKPGASYILDAEIYASNVSPGSHSVEVQWFDASNTWLDSGTVSSSSVNTWSHVTSSPITAPATASYAWILCRGYSAGTYNFDMINLTKSISLTDRFANAYNAGFNFLCSNGDSTLLSSIVSSGVGLKASFWPLPNDVMYQPDGKDPSDLINIVTGVSSSSCLSIWLGPDEPNIYGMSSAGIVNGCNIVKDNDSYYNTAPHSIWLNFAPRGTSAAPTDFTTLKPFCTAADIVSVDIYPVPEGNGHSVLADQTISCVGKYVDTLYSNVVSDGGAQRSAIWMVLQGGWSFGVSNSLELQWFDSNNVYLGSTTYQPVAAGSWQQITDSNIRPPAGATNVYVLARTYGAGTFYFDDIYFSTGGNNLISNSNVETGSPANWTTCVGSGGTQSQTWDTVTYHTSNHSLKTVMNGSGCTDWRQHITGINPANTYSLSAWVNASNLQMPLPTWTQTRFMAYDAIIHGARGLVYYEPAMTTIDSGAWSDLKNIATEISTLSNALTSYKSFRTVTSSNSNVETLLMEYNGNLYLLAANTSGSSTGNVTFTISGLGLSSASEFFESRQLTVTANHFTDSAFSGYQVHVYSIH